MRYVYEPLTSRSILRRVAEHEQQTGKRVTEVVLTHTEWCEFMCNEGPGLYHEPRPAYVSWQLRKHMPVVLSPFAPVYNIEESILTVRPEK